MYTFWMRRENIEVLLGNQWCCSTKITLRLLLLGKKDFLKKNKINFIFLKPSKLYLFLVLYLSLQVGKGAAIWFPLCHPDRFWQLSREVGSSPWAQQWWIFVLQKNIYPYPRKRKRREEKENRERLRGKYAKKENRKNVKCVKGGSWNKPSWKKCNVCENIRYTIYIFLYVQGFLAFIHLSFQRACTLSRLALKRMEFIFDSSGYALNTSNHASGWNDILEVNSNTC